MLIFLGVQTAVDVNHLLPSMLIFSLLVTGPKNYGRFSIKKYVEIIINIFNWKFIIIFQTFLTLLNSIFYLTLLYSIFDSIILHLPELELLSLLNDVYTSKQYHLNQWFPTTVPQNTSVPPAGSKCSAANE
jgi:hypothetical protein